MGEGKGCIVILASYEHNFIRVHEHLVQRPNNNISIRMTIQMPDNVRYAVVFKKLLVTMFR